MIDTDEYIEMWDDNLLGSEGVQILMNTLIAEVKRLRDKVRLLERAEATWYSMVADELDGDYPND